MSDIAVPVFANNRGGVSVFDSVEAMARQVEVIDIENDEYEFFDAEGQRLAAEVHGGRVTFHIETSREPEPERLASVLRSYFGRLRSHLASYSTRGTESSLEQLVALRLDLAKRRRRWLSFTKVGRKRR
jgi:hypothetical protein